MKKLIAALTGATAIAFFCVPAGAQQMSLKASHQFPGGKGDVRDEMMQIIARDPETGVLIGGSDARVEGDVLGY